MTFAPRPTYNRWNPAQQFAAGLDEPFTFTRALTENIGQGVLDSFGLGTVIRDTTAPGNLGERIDNRTGYKPMFDPFGILDSGEKSLTEEEYKASPSFREVVPWDKGMTESRAAALAEFADNRARVAHFSERQPIAAFLGQFVGQAFDPINYVPVFGPAARTAAIARFGGIGGRVLLSSSEAAINTAAFGVLTADIRRRLGDDVSFNAMAMEIGMSALIGGAFGAGIAIPAMRNERVRAREGARFERAEASWDRVRYRMDTLQNRQRAQIPLNGAIRGLSEDGVVDLNVNERAEVQRAQAMVAERSPERVRAETADVTGTKAGEVAITPTGTRVNVRPEVVELDTLQRAEGALQVRNRGSAVSDAQIEDIAINLDPARLMPNVAADQGAPIVGPDNVIDSGNGRVMALQRAYEAYPEKAAAYRAALEAAGYDVAGMQAPVLISRRTTDLSPEARAQFNAEANTSGTARMSAVEIGMMDRAAMDGVALAAFDEGPVTNAGNRAFVSRFLNNLPQNERGALLAGDGVSLNADGQRRIENALVAAAYGDEAVLRRFAEATDDNTRAVIGAMSDVAGRWAQMRHSIRTGEIGPEYDVTPELLQALTAVSRWRAQAAKEKRPASTVIREGMGQLDLLSGEMAPEAQVFVRMFYRNDHFAVATGREALAGRLNKVINSAYELGRPSLFGDALPVSREEMLRNAANDLETDLFAAGDAQPRAETGGAGGERPATGATRGADRQGTQKDPTRRGAVGVLKTMRDRFTAAGRSAEEAEALATMYAEAYRTFALRAGMSVDDFEARFPLPEVRQGADGEMLTPLGTFNNLAQGARPASLLPRAVEAPDTPEFRKWFGKSVLKRNGKPLVFYHGTNADFDVFARGAGGGGGFGAKDTKGAFFFTSRPDVAEDFAGYVWSVMDDGEVGKRYVEGANIMPVFLKVENPLHWNMGGGPYDEGFVAAAIKEAKRDGHDAVVFENMSDGTVTTVGPWKASHVVAVLKPTQIKSAIGNATFDPKSPSILLQSPRDITSTPEFRRWFGESKVVDAEGKPLVVYHGTNKGFEAFAPSEGMRYMGRPEPVTSPSFFFAADRDTAEMFASDRVKIDERIRKLPGGEAQVGAYYLRAENPLDLTTGLTPYPEGEASAILGEAAGYDYGYGPDTWEGVQEALDDPDAVAWLREEGYDAVVLRESDGGKAWAVFEPTQIKSTANRGTFDPNDPRLLFQPAWHGTPHIFDRFSSDKIGTGEGAQAFGHGLYFAGRKEVAQYYRDTLSQPQNIRPDAQAIAEHQAEWDALVAARREANGGELVWSHLTPEQQEKVSAVEKQMDDLHDLMIAETRKRMPEGGRLLKVDIPADDELLVWDAPLSEQPPKVKEAFKKFGIGSDKDPETMTDTELVGALGGFENTLGRGEKTGQGLYKELAAHFGGEDKASAALREAGIPGHRYLDQGSRNPQILEALERSLAAARQKLKARETTGADDLSAERGDVETLERQLADERAKQSYNYVIYDDSRVNILDFEQAPRPGTVRAYHGSMEQGGIWPLEARQPAGGMAAVYLSTDPTYAHRFARETFGDQREGQIVPVDVSGKIADRKYVQSLYAEGMDTPAIRERLIAEGYAGFWEDAEHTAMGIFDPANLLSAFRASEPDSFGQGPRGAIEFSQTGPIISLFETADASTALHESGHLFLSIFKSLAERPDAPDAIRGDWNTAVAWWDSNAEAVAADSPTPVTPDEVRAVLQTGTSGDRIKDLGINVGLQEQWARAFEAYLREGQAPVEGLRGMFEQFKRWLTAIYQKAIDLRVNLSPEIREVFGRLLGADEAEPTVDFSAPKPEPVSEGLPEAAARVGQPETMQLLAEGHGIDLGTGEYAEAFDIEGLRQDGRLGPDDEAALAAADEIYGQAEEYGKALKAALHCMV